ncbi:hypothetical protein JHD49_10485 [Sulfurimonas sp. SAG-AH-194-C21]|nr:hypothetical protein [Sulfurimonas sp. SAG-AH-194-C21]MDF1884368.1 hypothetical protein [Sulfurimonas sp. SAG-AH-194-C21]
MKLIKKSFIFLACTLVLSTQSLVADGAVITNKTTAIDSLSASDVKSFFMKKKTSFSNGKSVEVADQTEDSDTYNEFTKTVIGKKPKKLKRYWSKRVFSGKGTPPKVVGDDAAMLKWVAKTPNSLGYISADKVDDSVKVLLKY